MIVVIDGPEKAGKTTLIANVRTKLSVGLGIPTRIRKWTGRAIPDDRIYAEALMEDVRDPFTVTIWDRSWVSESVYGRLLGQSRRLAADPKLGEWLHGRVAQTVGSRYILIANTEITRELRDETDLPVDPIEERDAFYQYAKHYGWEVLFNDYTQRELADNTTIIVDEVRARRNRGEWDIDYTKLVSPPAYAGPIDSPVLFVARSMANDKPYPGGWIPFTDREMYHQLQRMISMKTALNCGWTNLDNMPPGAFDNRRLIVFWGSGNWPAVPYGTTRANFSWPVTFTVNGSPSLASLEYLVSRKLEARNVETVKL